MTWNCFTRTNQNISNNFPALYTQDVTKDFTVLTFQLFDKVIAWHIDEWWCEGDKNQSLKAPWIVSLGVVVMLLLLLRPIVLRAACGGQALKDNYFRHIKLSDSWFRTWDTTSYLGAWIWTLYYRLFKSWLDRIRSEICWGIVLGY